MNPTSDERPPYILNARFSHRRFDFVTQHRSVTKISTKDPHDTWRFAEFRPLPTTTTDSATSIITNSSDIFASWIAINEQRSAISAPTPDGRRTYRKHKTWPSFVWCGIILFRLCTDTTKTDQDMCECRVCMCVCVCVLEVTSRG